MSPFTLKPSGRRAEAAVVWLGNLHRPTAHARSGLHGHQLRPSPARRPYTPESWRPRTQESRISKFPFPFARPECELSPPQRPLSAPPRPGRCAHARGSVVLKQQRGIAVPQSAGSTWPVDSPEARARQMDGERQIRT